MSESWRRTPALREADFVVHQTCRARLTPAVARADARGADHAYHASSVGRVAYAATVAEHITHIGNCGGCGRARCARARSRGAGADPWLALDPRRPRGAGRSLQPQGDGIEWVFA